MVLIRMASPSRMPSIKHLSDAQCQAVRHAASKHAAGQTWHTPTRLHTRSKPPRPTSQGAAPPRLLRLPPLSQATATPRIHSHPERHRLLQTDSTPDENILNTLAGAPLHMHDATRSAHPGAVAPTTTRPGQGLFVVKCTFAARDLVLAKYVCTHFESNAELLVA